MQHILQYFNYTINFCRKKKLWKIKQSFMMLMANSKRNIFIVLTVKQQEYAAATTYIDKIIWYFTIPFKCVAYISYYIILYHITLYSLHCNSSLRWTYQTNYTFFGRVSVLSTNEFITYGRHTKVWFIIQWFAGTNTDYNELFGNCRQNLHIFK